MISQLKKGVRNFFGVSKREVNGILILMFITMGILILPVIYTPILKSYSNSGSPDLAILDSIAATFYETAVVYAASEKSSKKANSELYSFNPNSETFSNLIRLGLDSIIVKRIIKYRNNGGEFHFKKDLKKIYGLEDSDYKRLSPWIELPEKSDIIEVVKNTDKYSDKVFPAITKTEVIPAQYDINEIDSTLLMGIKGIGKVYSSRIIKYRNLLGGYVSLSQLDEVYGIPGDALINVKEVVYMDSTFDARHIKINFAVWHELVKHPYVNSKLANNILKARSIYGPIKNMEDLLNLDHEEDSILQKVERYIVY